MIFSRIKLLFVAASLVVIGSLLQLLPTAAAFVVVNPNAARPSSRLFLEDWVADMVDQEIWRQSHKAEYEQKWMEKNRGAVLQSANRGDFMGMMMLDDERDEFRQHAKDEKMARNNPEQYCADRCLATGNCDVYEDFFELGPEEVVKFCSECVLSDGDEPCDVPDGFYDHQLGLLKP